MVMMGCGWWSGCGDVGTESGWVCWWMNCRLEIKQAAEGGHHVPGLVEAQVSSMEEVWEVLQAGSSSRTVGSTRANDHSSRSHWCVDVVWRVGGACDVLGWSGSWRGSRGG